MTPFLNTLKLDAANNAAYLKLLRPNAKFIRVCECNKNENVHSYCKTAQVIQEQRIYCLVCDNHYNIHVFNANFNTRNMLFKWFALLILVLVCIFLFAMLDVNVKKSNHMSEGEDVESWLVHFEVKSTLVLMAPVILIFSYGLYHNLE